jgi:glucose-1-phosphate thymidylyltransferase
MKIIIPVAGRGTRVRPHSYSKPKPFIRVGKTTPIEFMIKHMLTTNPSEIIIIHDKYGTEYYKEKLPKLFPQVKFQFACQEKPLGPMHALTFAIPFLNDQDDILINFCDTLFVKDLSCIQQLKQDHDGVLFAQEVEDYQRFGVILHEKNIMKEIIEKPDQPVSKLANIGTYYIKKGLSFLNTAKQLVEGDGKLVRGEYYLPSAFMKEITNGKRYWVEGIDDWLDVGKIETILQTNKKLLKGEIYKEEGVKIENCTLGENVSIGKNTTLINCTITNAIIGENTIIEGITMQDSIIGDHVILKKEATTFNIGDDSFIQ